MASSNDQEEELELVFDHNVFDPSLLEYGDDDIDESTFINSITNPMNDKIEDNTQLSIGGGSLRTLNPLQNSDTLFVGINSNPLPNQAPIPPSEYGTCSSTASTSYSGYSSDNRTEQYKLRETKIIEGKLDLDELEFTITRRERNKMNQMIREKFRNLPSVEFDGIGFSLYDKEVEELGIEITKDKDTNNQNTVNDPRLGLISGTKTCSTCANTLEYCTGHIGWIKLNRFYSPDIFKKLIVKVLEITCITCKRLLIDMHDLKRHGFWKYKNNDPNLPIIWNYHNDERLKVIHELVMKNKNRYICKRKNIDSNGGVHNCMKNPEYSISNGRIHYRISKKHKYIPLELEQIRYILKQIPEWEYIITETEADNTTKQVKVTEHEYEEINQAQKRNFTEAKYISPGNYMSQEITTDVINTVILTPHQNMLRNLDINNVTDNGDGTYTIANKGTKISANDYQISIQYNKRNLTTPILLSNGGYLVTETEADNKLLTTSPKTSVMPISEYNRIIDIQKRNIIIDKRIESDSQIMGFDPPAHPMKMIMRYVVVPPRCIRPPSTRDGQEIQDDITQILTTIVRQNNIIGSSLKLRTDKMTLYDMFPPVDRDKDAQASVQKLAGNIHSLFFGGQANTTRREYTSIRKLIQGKHGFIRRFMTGKRGDYGARTVLSPGPELEYGEIGIPERFASILTMPETVTYQNMSVLQNHIHNGKVSKIRFGNDRERFITVKPGEIPDYHLKVGDVVERYLQNGDYVAFNRNPSLHKYSIMGYRVKLIDTLTIRLNINTTPHHNADFDGDEGNVFMPRTIEAVAELQSIMNARYCLQSGQDNKPLTGLIMNDLTAAYKLTQVGVMVNEYTWQECMAILNRKERLAPANQLATLSKRLEKHGLHPRSGKALFSALFPPDFAYRGGNGLTIIDGVLTSDIPINKGTSGITHRSILQFLLKNYSLERGALFLSDSQFLLKRWLKDDPVTTSLSDCYPKVNPSEIIYPLYEIFNSDNIKLYLDASDKDELDFKNICVQMISSNTDYSNYNVGNYPNYKTIDDRSKENGVDDLSLPKFLISGILPTDLNLNVDNKIIVKNGLFLADLNFYHNYNQYKDSIDEDLKEIHNKFKGYINIESYKSEFISYIRTNDGKYIDKIMDNIKTDSYEDKDTIADDLRKIAHKYSAQLKQLANKYRTSIIKSLANDYGSNRAFVFRRDLNFILEQCLGISKHGGKHYEMLRREIEKSKAVFELYGADLNDPLKKERTNKLIIAQLDNVTRVGEQTMETNLENENNFALIVKGGGTKDGAANMGQIMGMLGTQFEGTKLIANGGDNIYQAEGDLDPENYGFISSNFLTGLNPTEFFFHSMASRSGLVDTSIKTAAPGDLTRQMVKTFEDVMINHDQTVRLAGGPIIQTLYGNTRFNPEFMINVDFPDGTIPFFIDVESVANRLNSEFYERTQAVDIKPASTVDKNNVKLIH